MKEIIRDFPNFTKHLKNDIVKLYDDDLKLFLIASLRKVDYMKNAGQEVLTNLAYVCRAEIKEKGALLYSMDEDIDDQINDELIIVFNGAIELYLVMDAGTEFQLEVLSTGSILNPHNMLSFRKHSSNSRFTMNTTFYYLKYTQLVEVAKKFPSFYRELVKQFGKAASLKSRDQNPVDFIRGTINYTDTRDNNYSAIQSEKIFSIMFAFKNSVVYYLLKNRKDRKVKNLKKILEEFITKKNKQKEMQRIKKREMDQLPLAERLEKLIDGDKILTDI
jgi:CRP-like cAMP-binding protein